MYFGRGEYLRPGFAYQPTVIIDTGSLVITLFGRPAYSHYYFGDYYDARYARQGIYPWYVSQTEHRWNDPIYEQERWRQLRRDPQWDAHQRQAFDQRVQNPQSRPPRTLQDQQAWQKVHPQPTAAERQMVMAQPLKDFAAAKSTGVKFETIKPEQRKDIEQKVEQVRRDQVERSKIETAAPPAKMPERLPRPGIAPKVTPVPPVEVKRPEVKTPPVEIKRPEVKTPPIETTRPEVRPVPVPPVEVKRPEVKTPPIETTRPEVRPVPVPPVEVKRPEVKTPPIETTRPEVKPVPVPPVEVKRPEVKTPPVEIKRPEVKTPPIETTRPEVKPIAGAAGRDQAAGGRRRRRSIPAAMRNA